MVIFQKRRYKTDKQRKSVTGNLLGNPKKYPEVGAVTLQYSQHSCSAQIAFPRWLTPEQMLLVKVLAAMHQVQTLFSFTSTDSFLHRLPTQKTYQLAWGNQSWGDTIPDQSVVCESVVCDACKTPAVIAQLLDVLVLELFFIVGLFSVSLALIRSLLLTAFLFLSFFLSFHCYIYAS